jgi:hypothetical protein
MTEPTDRATPPPTVTVQGVTVPKWFADREGLQPDHVPGQLDLTDRELSPDELTAADEHFRAELDRIRAARTELAVRAVSRVATAAANADAAAADLDAAVADARNAGATWDQIGRAAGMARQSAWRRWGKVPDDFLTGEREDER